MSIDRRRGFVRVAEHQAEELERWAYPDYGDEFAPQTENALNFDPAWAEEPELIEEPEPELPSLTAADLDAIRQSAYEEGFTQGQTEGHAEGFAKGQAEGLAAGEQQGLEQGMAQGLEQGQAQITEQVGYLAQVVERLAAPLHQVDGEVEQQLVALAMQLARELIRVEVKTNPQVLLHTLREVVESLPVANRKVIIHLHPEDITVVEQHFDQQALEDRNWALRAEPSLERGDVNVQSGDSHIEFVMESRIAQLMQQFIGVNSPNTPA